MNISEYITHLQKMLHEHGDIPAVGMDELGGYHFAIGPMIVEKTYVETDSGSVRIDKVVLL